MYGTMSSLLEGKRENIYLINCILTYIAPYSTINVQIVRGESLFICLFVCFNMFLRIVFNFSNNFLNQVILEMKYFFSLF